jgi:predicted glycosyltransferase
MWFSDLVISAGGTMNREAAALGIPVYSIFKGKSAAVDRYLAAIGKLVLLENKFDVNNIRLVRRESPLNPIFREQAALAAIVKNVTNVLELSYRSDTSKIKL